MELKKWLDSGSINLFGMPFSGKDTQGKRLADFLGGKFLSSGEIIREMEQKEQQNLTGGGDLIPSNLFYKAVLPYFEKRELIGKPLVLSSIGRWEGEEDTVMNTALGAGHPIKVAVYFWLNEAEIFQRWEAAKLMHDRGNRPDDGDRAVLANRIQEFKEKTLPVLRHYRDLDLLIIVDGTGSQAEIFNRMLTQLAEFAQKH